MSASVKRRVGRDDVCLVLVAFFWVGLVVWAANVGTCEDPTRDFGRSDLGPLCRPTGVERGPGATVGEVVAMVAVAGASLIISGALMLVAGLRDSRRWMWFAVGAGALAAVGSLIALGEWATIPEVPPGP